MYFIDKVLNLFAPIFEKKEKDRKQLLLLIPKNSVCAEIGVWKGNFSDQILKVVKPQKLHLIDPWKFLPAYSDRWYGGTIAKSQADMDKVYKEVKKKFNKDKRVTVHRDFSDSVVSEFKDTYFDFVYIDANHSYEFVKKDLTGFFSKLKKGGIMAGDDYYSFWSALHGFPVKRAVDEFVKIGFCEILSLRGQFVLRKK
jgi:hypothetical protein